jgi:hypothetical protein
VQRTFDGLPLGADHGQIYQKAPNVMFQMPGNQTSKIPQKLLIKAPSNLFQIDVTYFFKSSTKELKFIIHASMMGPIKLL